LDIVKRDKPHGLLLMGPFLEQTHPDLLSGELFYNDEKNEMQFVDYNDLFQSLLEMIKVELKGQTSTKVMIVPSTKDIHHI
jgi:hypothetical protein